MVRPTSSLAAFTAHCDHLCTLKGSFVDVAQESDKTLFASITSGHVLEPWGHCLEQASRCCSGNRTLGSGVTVTDLDYCATEAVLRVHGVLRAVHSDLRPRHRRSCPSQRMAIFRSSAVSLDRYHSVPAPPTCQPTVCTWINMPSPPNPWGDGRAVIAPICLRRRRFFGLPSPRNFIASSSFNASSSVGSGLCVDGCSAHSNSCRGSDRGHS